MKAFDSDGDFLQILRQRFAQFLPQRLKSRNRQEGAPAFARAQQPGSSDGFGLAFGITHDDFQRGRGEPEIHFIAQRAEVETARFGRRW